jgi:hypothetical protein
MKRWKVWGTIDLGNKTGKFRVRGREEIDVPTCVRMVSIHRDDGNCEEKARRVSFNVWRPFLEKCEACANADREYGEGFGMIEKDYLPDGGTSWIVRFV